jgi:hypothetical protein
MVKCGNWDSALFLNVKIFQHKKGEKWHKGAC